MRAIPRSAHNVAFGLVAYSFVVIMLGTTLPTPLYPVYQQRYGYSGLLTTVIFAAYAVGVIAALLLLGRLSDQIGRRPVLLLGVALSALSAAAFLVPLGLPSLFVGRVLSGVSAGIYTGTATATLLDLVPDAQRARASLVGAAVNMAGLGLGPLVAGMLAQYAPWPLTLPFVASLVLLVPAAVGVAVMPEPVADAVPWRGTGLRPQRLRVPAEARPVFVRAVIAGFAGFAVLGLFSAVSGSFLAQVLGVHDHAVDGLLVFSLLAASTVGQLVSARLHAVLVGGTALLGVGTLVIAAALLLASLPVLLVGAVVAGLGQGASFRAGLGAVGAASPASRRAEVSSSFFVVVYVALSVPVIGVGAAAQGLGLTTAGVGFSVVVAALAAGAVVALRHRGADQASDAPPGG